MRLFVVSAVFFAAVSTCSGVRLGEPDVDEAERARLAKEVANAGVAHADALQGEPATQVAGKSYTLGSSRKDYSVGKRRTKENAGVASAEMYGEMPRPHAVQDLFQNGVDMSAELEALRAREPTVGRDVVSGAVEDGLQIGTTFGEDPNEVGKHAYPDEPAPVNEWNPVPPGYQPVVPIGQHLFSHLIDTSNTGSTVLGLSDDDEGKVNPDGLGAARDLVNDVDSKKHKANLVYRPVQADLPGSVQARAPKGVGIPSEIPADSSV